MRHFTRDRSPFRVRLACVKHAASVQSEPESNSPVQICSKDLRWTEIRISKFLPVRYSLVNEPRRFTRREAVVYAASFSLSTSFFSFRESFFRGPSGQLVGARETYVSFSNSRQELFLPSGKISFPVALSDVAGSLARTTLCAFSTPPSSIFPQKILRICSPLTDYSINALKRHKKMFGIFFAVFHFSSPLFAEKNHTPLLEKASFPLQKTILPFRPASYFLCHGTKGHTEGRKIHRTQRPGCDIESTACCPFPLRKEERQKQAVLLYLRYPQQEAAVPAKNAKGILPGRQPDKGSPAISSTGLYPARPSRAVIIFSTS